MTTAADAPATDSVQRRRSAAVVTLAAAVVMTGGFIGLFFTGYGTTSRAVVDGVYVGAAVLSGAAGTFTISRSAPISYLPMVVTALASLGLLFSYLWLLDPGRAVANIGMTALMLLSTLWVLLGAGGVLGATLATTRRR